MELSFGKNKKVSVVDEQGTVIGNTDNVPELLKIIHENEPDGFKRFELVTSDPVQKLIATKEKDYPDFSLGERVYILAYGDDDYDSTGEGFVTGFCLDFDSEISKLHPKYYITEKHGSRVMSDPYRIKTLTEMRNLVVKLKNEKLSEVCTEIETKYKELRL